MQPSAKDSPSVARRLAGALLLYLVFDGICLGAFDIRFGNTLSLSALAVAGCLASIAFDSSKEPHRLRRLLDPALAAVALFVAIVVTSALTVGSGLDISFIKNLSIVATIIYVVDSESWMRAVLGAVVLGGLYQVWQGALQAAASGLPSDGLTGGLGNHVQYGLYVGIAASAWLPFAWGAKIRERRVAGMLLLLPVTAVLVATNARGSIIAVLLAAVAAAFVGSASCKVRFGVVAGSAAVFAAAAAASERLRSVLTLPFVLGDLERVDAILSSRGQFLAAAWRMFIERPVFGHGYGNYQLTWYEYAPVELLNPWSVGHPFAAHSTYLQILAELGVVGLVPYVAAIWLAVSRAVAACRSAVTRFARAASMIVLAGLLAFVIHGILDNSGWHDRAFYVYLGLAIAAPAGLVREVETTTERVSTDVSDE